MIRRCHKPAPSDYRNYIARNYHDKGISVCGDWRSNFENFREWAVSNGYADNLTIDRIDADGNYEPSNCRWITFKENASRVKKYKGKRETTIPHKKIGKYEVLRFRPGATYGVVVQTRLMYAEAKEVQHNSYENDRNTRSFYAVRKPGKDMHDIGDFVELN